MENVRGSKEAKCVRLFFAIMPLNRPQAKSKGSRQGTQNGRKTKTRRGVGHELVQHSEERKSQTIKQRSEKKNRETKKNDPSRKVVKRYQDPYFRVRPTTRKNERRTFN